MIRTIEEFSLGAWPARQQVLHDGWILRFSGGYTRRANCINPLYQGATPTAAKVDLCERMYRQRKLPVVFKMTPASCPAELDRELASRGYAVRARTSVQCMSLTDVAACDPPADAAPVRHWERPTDEWTDCYVRLNGVPAEHHAALRGILDGIAAPVCFASWHDAQGVAACGMAVLQDRHVGLFDIVTDPARRRLGHASRLIRYLLAWAREHGATTSYLQVMLENAPALALYQKLGFVETYQYWYRIKP